MAAPIVPMSSYHIVMAELHTGMLVLAGLCIFAIALTKLLPGINKFGAKTQAMLDPTSYVAATLGGIIMALTGIVGFLVDPIRILLILPAAENKIMFSAFAGTLWLIVVLIRTKFKSDLWNNRGLSVTYTLITFVAMGFLTITGCEGAHISGITSPFDPLWYLLGLNLNNSLIIFTSTLSYAVIAVGIVLIVVSLVLALRFRKR